MALLEVQELVTTVPGGARPAVDGISFSIDAGRTLGLVGESGSGKSLTAMSIMRILPEPAVRITSGRIVFDGVDLARAGDAALCEVRGRRIAMVFQEPSTALNPVMTVGDQVGEPLRVHLGLPRAEAARRAIALLDQVGIPAPAERARAYPHQLSGGMKQRAVIAMALACHPALLIADEPTTALDVTVQAQILTLLARLGRELGMALLLITHDLAVVAETCDEVAVMYAGRIVEHAAVPELFAHPRHPYTVGLLRAMPHAEPAGLAGQGARQHRLREIPGTVPPLTTVASGCSFADRCPNAAADCRAAMPPLSERGRGHLVRCLHPFDGGPPS